MVRDTLQAAFYGAQQKNAHTSFLSRYSLLKCVEKALTNLRS